MSDRESLGEPALGEEVSEAVVAQVEKLVQERVETERRGRDFASSEEYRVSLLRLYSDFSDRQQFEPGQVVRWKDGLQNKTYPYFDSVAVVIEHRTDPIVNREHESGSQYFHEPLDLALAVLVGEEQQFAVYWFDSRRFELVD